MYHTWKYGKDEGFVFLSPKARWERHLEQAEEEADLEYALAAEDDY